MSKSAPATKFLINTVKIVENSAATLHSLRPTLRVYF